MIGLDQCIAAISGAAPIAVEVFDFFRALGVPISEIYGMSESSGPMTWAPFQIKAGTVGPAIPGCEVRLAEDGEVICRGGNVFRGYLDDPEKTAEALDAEGWLHSGDIGVFDDDGYLRIVDRKKELIITAGGKNVSPANLEAALKAEELIGQACVIGEGRPFISALVVLDAEVAPAWAKHHGIEPTSLLELADHPEVREEVDREVRSAMEAFNQAESVKKVKILHAEWMPDSEELTPTMKLKRRGIYAKYIREIEELYTVAHPSRSFVRLPRSRGRRGSGQTSGQLVRVSRVGRSLRGRGRGLGPIPARGRPGRRARGRSSACEG